MHDEFLKNTQKLFNEGFDTNYIDKGNDYLLHSKKISYTITSTSNQIKNKYNNISTINLNECEKELKKQYNIPNNSSIYILKIDNYIYTIPKIEYELYYPFSLNNLTKLNLSICKNIKR